MPRTTLLLTLAVFVGLTATASAQTTSTASPTTAGSASTLTFDVDGLADPVLGRLPNAIRLQAPGFKVNTSVATKRCKAQQAQIDGKCPSASRIGTGKLLVGVASAEGTRDADVAITVYLQSPKKALAVAEVFGWQVIPGVLNTKGGLDVTFDPLPTGLSFPGFTFTFKRMSFDFGARRTIKVKRTKRVNGKRVVKTTKKKVSFLKSPATCDGGSWASSATLTLQDTSTVALPAPTACTAR